MRVVVDSVVRSELLDASDEIIDDAVGYADPMVLRGLLYQLTGDEEVASTRLGLVVSGFAKVTTVADDDDVALLREKAASFLKGYRDSGAEAMSIGPEERLPVSLRLAAGFEVPDEAIPLYLEALALDPWARSLEWQAPPP